MSKTTFKPGTMLNPVPAVMVSCGSTPEEENIITIAWTGIINTEPPLTYVSVRKSRFSHDVIQREGEFVINLTTEALVKAADFCGVRSRRDIDKFSELKLTKEKGDLVKCPMIAESPVNLECKVQEMRSYPTHDMFIAEIVSVHVDTELLDENGRFALETAGLVAYSHGEYFGLQKKPLGRFGFSVMKEKTKKRIAGEQRQKYRDKLIGVGKKSGSGAAVKKYSDTSAEKNDSTAVKRRDDGVAARRTDAGTMAKRYDDSAASKKSAGSRVEKSSDRKALYKDSNGGKERYRGSGKSEKICKAGSTGKNTNAGKSGNTGKAGKYSDKGNPWKTDTGSNAGAARKNDKNVTANAGTARKHDKNVTVNTGAAEKSSKSVNAGAASKAGKSHYAGSVRIPGKSVNGGKAGRASNTGYAGTAAGNSGTKSGRKTGK